MRGEDRTVIERGDIVCGSPPHARGRPLIIVTSSKRQGLTPACAGKTSITRPSQHVSWAHPRMRGEDRRLAFAQCAIWGSPPHARGRPGGESAHEGVVGLTPACAGKTVVGVPTAARLRAHPRMRGEDTAVMMTVNRKTGSPPHARGRHPGDWDLDF